MPNEVVLDGNSLRIEDVVAVARDFAPVALSRPARERAAGARRTVDRLVADGAVVYGVTTGFGKLSDVAIPPARLAELQRNRYKQLRRIFANPIFSAKGINALAVR